MALWAVQAQHAFLFAWGHGPGRCYAAGSSVLHSWPEGCPERERQGTADPPPRDAAAQKVSVRSLDCKAPQHRQAEEAFMLERNDAFCSC